VKPQTGAFLEKARELLEQAQKMLDADLNEPAGRTAYLAGFHAAQALIFEAHSRVFKTHSGVQAEFLKLTKDNPRVDTELGAFLGHAYNLKAIADYETGPGSHLSAGTAGDAIQNARRFVDCVTALIPPNGQAPEAPPEP
jgi:uncharacterized protein (UPF0332 family)